MEVNKLEQELVDIEYMMQKLANRRTAIYTLLSSQVKPDKDERISENKNGDT